jgi:hypothetical protein
MVIVVAALVEILTGLALMTFPSVFVRLVYGADATGVVITLGRMAGFGLLAFGIACWPERGARLSTPALRGLLTYNVLIAAMFAYLAINRVPVGFFFWPALALHVVLAILLVRTWLANRV